MNEPRRRQFLNGCRCGQNSSPTPQCKQQQALPPLRRLRPMNRCGNYTPRATDSFRPPKLVKRCTSGKCLSSSFHEPRIPNNLAGNFPSTGYNGIRDQIRLGRVGASGPFVFWEKRSVLSHHCNPSLKNPARDGSPLTPAKKYLSLPSLAEPNGRSSNRCRLPTSEYAISVGPGRCSLTRADLSYPLILCVR